MIRTVHFLWRPVKYSLAYTVNVDSIFYLILGSVFKTFND